MNSLLKVIIGIIACGCYNLSPAQEKVFAAQEYQNIRSELTQQAEDLQKEKLQIEASGTFRSILITEGKC